MSIAQLDFPLRSPQKTVYCRTVLSPKAFICSQFNFDLKFEIQHGQEHT